MSHYTIPVTGVLLDSFCGVERRAERLSLTNKAQALTLVLGVFRIISCPTFSATGLPCLTPEYTIFPLKIISIAIWS